MDAGTKGESHWKLAGGIFRADLSSALYVIELQSGKRGRSVRIRTSKAVFSIVLQRHDGRGAVFAPNVAGDTLLFPINVDFSDVLLGVPVVDSLIPSRTYVHKELDDRIRLLRKRGDKELIDGSRPCANTQHLPTNASCLMM